MITEPQGNTNIRRTRSITFLWLWASALIGSVAGKARRPGGGRKAHTAGTRWRGGGAVRLGGVRGTLTKTKMVVVFVLTISGR